MRYFTAYLTLLVKLFLLNILVIQNALADKCLFVSSYHRGYAWSDGIERGLRSVLERECELLQFDMDSKRHKNPDYIRAKALEVKALIESWKPDVVITADDNAAKYVIQEHFKDHSIPFVFCGVNWTVEEYGFPYSNVTGMVEVAPIYYMLETVKKLLARYEQAIYIGANTHTEAKNLSRFTKALERDSLRLDHRLVDTANEWLDAYRAAQDYDFVIMGSNSGIKDWREAEIVDAILPMSKRLSVTNHGWMMPYTMLGFTKVPEEQGVWSGRAAYYILNGRKPSDIPIASNRKWDIWTNGMLLESSGVVLPKHLLMRAKLVP